MSTLPPVVYEDDEVAPGADGHAASEQATGGVWDPPGLGWSLFEFGRNPYYILVNIYIFGPYVAQHIAGGGAEGQATIAGATKWAGIGAALSAPFLGAMMDRGGRRKPLMAAVLGVLVICACLMWFVRPGPEGIGLTASLSLLVVGSMAFAYSEVLHNAMLPLAGRPDAQSGISGVGLAMGNLASVLLFAFMLWAFLFPLSGLKLPGIPETPMFGLDASQFEIQRLVGPLSAVWIVLFVIPFFLYMPDGAKPGGTWTGAARELLGITAEKDPNAPRISAFEKVRRRVTLFLSYVTRLFRESPEVMKFLVARMIYADGLIVILTLSGVYVATFLGWKNAEIPLYAIWASVFAAVGGYVGGIMDRLFGARNALVVEISAVTFFLFLQLSVTPDSILFGMIPAGEPLWEVEIFNTLSDLFYLGIVAAVAAFITAAISSSRFMLVAIAPRERVGEFFGLYAVVGTVTVWLGPMLVEIFTSVSGSQRVGMAAPVVLFAIGLALLLRVKLEGRPGDGLRASAQDAAG